MSSAIQIKGDSFRRQAEASAKYAAEHDLDLIDDYKLADLGVSAFKSDNLTTGALGRFVAECEAGEIEAGSFLLIESLDRLSRDKILDAFSLFARILKTGVKIVTLSDGQVYDGSSDQVGSIYYAISVMIRSNDESKIKSTRGLANWSQKRKLAAEHGVKMSSQCPAWLKLSDDRKSYLIDKERAKIVQRIFEASASGKGANLITKELNRDNVPTFGRGALWAEAFVSKTLRNRAVLGEFQPGQYVNGKRQPAGDPIPNYFPPVIEEELFDIVQASLRGRLLAGGRRGEGQSNIFTHVAFCGYCGSKMRHRSKGSRVKGNPPHRYLTCFNRFNGPGCDCKPLPYAAFERSFLTFVRDVDLRGLLEGAKRKSEAKTIADRITVNQEKVKKADERIRDYLMKIEGAPDLAEIFMERIRELKTEKDDLVRSIEESNDALSKIKSDNVTDEELASLISTFQNPCGENRIRLADRIKSIIERIDVYPNGEIRKDDPAIDLVRASGDPDAEKIIAAMNAGSRLKDDPYFIVTFRNGAVQTVVPNPSNPDDIRVSVYAGEKTRRVEGSAYEYESD